MMTDQLTADDQRRLAMIWDASDDPEQLAAQIYEYYHDKDRADRTPRSAVYLHMGLLTGWLRRSLERLAVSRGTSETLPKV